MSRSPQLHVVGISHHTAEVGVRERLALSVDDMSRLLQGAAAAGRSLVILSTCNRLEFYWWGGEDQESEFRQFARDRDVELHPALLYRRDGEAAVRHLFAVAAGLDSQVMGELEVLGQVRRAHQLAAAAGASTWEMDLAFAAAIAAGRRVRREGVLGRHPASVSSTAVQHAARCLGGTLADASVLVLGAGEVAVGVLRAIEAQGGAARVTLQSRRGERSRVAAASVPGARAECHSWNELRQALLQADVVITATGSRTPVVTAAALAHALAGRTREAGLAVLDLGVPRNVDPAARDLPGVRLFDLDDLRLQHCPAPGPGSPALAGVTAILERELDRYGRALRHRDASAELAELHRLGAALAREEAERAIAELGSLPDDKSDVVRRMAERLTRRLLYPASRTLRDR
jgi:glutamyl-tRNA reductase